MVALVKLALVFAGIVMLLRLRWNLGLVLLLASVAVGILFAYPLLEVGRDVIRASVDLLTLRLALVVVLIMILGELLRQTAGLKGMVEALQALIPSGRIVLMTLPPLIGLLPMVGGAMFSAPMVDEVGDRLGADAGRKTFVNYWFRHIWEPILPLYPSMLLATELLGLTTTQLTRVTWPLTLAAAAGGLIFGVVGLPRRGNADPPQASRAQRLRTLAASIWPVVLVVVLTLALAVIDERANLLISLVATIVLMMLINRVPLLDLGTILRERIPWKTVVVIFGALIFRRVLDNSGAVIAVSNALTDLRVPLAVVALAVPFIAGLLTGLMSAAFGISFPVILPLVTVDGGATAPGWAVWMLAAGFLGTMSSPVHLCLALTRVYFKAQWGSIYRRIVPSVLLMIIVAAVVMLLV
jgi:integral membrane protein (TIGR00529 family)